MFRRSKQTSGTNEERKNRTARRIRKCEKRSRWFEQCALFEIIYSGKAEGETW